MWRLKKQNMSYKWANIFFKLIASFTIIYFYKLFFYLFWHVLWNVICSVALLLLSSNVFVHRTHWCVYLQILYNTMDFYKWKLSLIWNCMNYLQKNNGTQLLKHWGAINSSYILACVGVYECNCTPLTNRPVYVSIILWPFLNKIFTM